MRPRAARGGAASHRLLQALICAGAVAAAGAVTMEARISIKAQAPQIATAQAASPAPMPPARPMAATQASVDPAEAKARLAAQRALALAMAKASAQASTQTAQAAAPAPSLPTMQAAAVRVAAAANPTAAVPSPARPSAPVRASAPAPSVPAGVSTVAQTPANPPLTDADLRQLAGKAAQALRAGDIGGARMVLERAASAGDATAVFALGETYDPNVLAKMRVRGLRGDVNRALELYKRASAAGVPQARDRLNDLRAPVTAAAN